MSKKINISIVGTGLMGLQHIKAIYKSKKAKGCGYPAADILHQGRAQGGTPRTFFGGPQHWKGP